MNNITESSLKTNKNKYEDKLFLCRNFEFPYLEIKKYEGNKYYLNFLNENKRTEKVRVYKNEVPEEISQLFNLKFKESIHGLLTDITCIQTTSN